MEGRPARLIALEVTAVVLRKSLRVCFILIPSPVERLRFTVQHKTLIGNSADPTRAFRMGSDWFTFADLGSGLDSSTVGFYFSLLPG
jgi:hypothetical protein